MWQEGRSERKKKVFPSNFGTEPSLLQSWRWRVINLIFPVDALHSPVALRSVAPAVHPAIALEKDAIPATTPLLHYELPPSSRDAPRRALPSSAARKYHHKISPSWTPEICSACSRNGRSRTCDCRRDGGSSSEEGNGEGERRWSGSRGRGRGGEIPSSRVDPIKWRGGAQAVVDDQGDQRRRYESISEAGENISVNLRRN